MFSNETLVEGFGLVAGLAEASLHDPELASMQAELQALKAEVDTTTSCLSESMWDSVEDDDLRFMFHIKAGPFCVCRLTDPV